MGPGPSLFHLYLSHPVTFYAMPTPELTCLLLLVRGRNLRMVIFEGEDHLRGGGGKECDSQSSSYRHQIAQLLERFMGPGFEFMQ